MLHEWFRNDEPNPCEVYGTKNQDMVGSMLWFSIAWPKMRKKIITGSIILSQNENQNQECNNVIFSESLMWTSFAMVDVSLGAMNVVVSGMILLLVMLIYCKATRILPGWFQDLETYNLSLLSLNKQHLEQLADVKVIFYHEIKQI